MVIVGAINADNYAMNSQVIPKQTALIVLAAFLLVACTARRPNPTVTLAVGDGNDQIAFASDRNGNMRIYLMNADGSGQTSLTDNLASSFTPAWSPDGTRIAFNAYVNRNAEIYVMKADGSGQTNLTNQKSMT